MDDCHGLAQVVHALGQVRAVDGKGHREFDQSLFGPVDADRQAGQSAKLRLQERGRHMALPLADVLRATTVLSPVTSRYTFSSAASALRVGQDGVDLGQGVIAGHAGDGPVRQATLRRAG